jgi:hypothetical protein
MMQISILIQIKYSGRSHLFEQWKYFSFFTLQICQLSKRNYFCTRFLKAGGALAQLVEQWTENPCVPSSNLGGTTQKRSSFNRMMVFFVLRVQISILRRTLAIQNQFHAQGNINKG